VKSGAPNHREDIKYKSESVIRVGDNCSAIFAEVMLPYTFKRETTNLKIFNELIVAENLVW